ncbi:MAG: hypothetical protein KJ043_07190 [Anaerolineae bacterium]|nr:hypothetical protein [Anaerolineae bacterium]
MTSENKSYAVQVTLIFTLLMFTMIACVFFQPVTGSVFTNAFTELGGVETTSTPENVAKIWLEGIFNADAKVIRDNLCEAQRAEITDEVVETLASSMSGTGMTIDMTGVIYTFNEAEQSVQVSGSLKVTVQDTSVDVPMSSFPLADLPMIEENGRWFVCIDVTGTF